MIALLEMPLIRRLVPLSLALLVTAAVFEMIRRRKLREEFATMWLGGAVVLLAFGIFPDILFWLQGILQMGYLTLVTLIGFGMVSLILLHLTVMTSKQATQIRRLSQRLALQNQRLESLRPARQAEAAEPTGEGGDGPGDDPAFQAGSSQSESA